MIESLLKQVSPDATLLVAEADEVVAGNAVLAMRAAGLIALVVRGQKMRTDDALFDEVAAALQFPSYFGENWNALDECLRDLDWWPFGEGRVIVVQDADQVLVDVGEDERLPDDATTLDILVRRFARAYEEFGQPIAQGAWFDRPPIPFHVVLHVEPALAPNMHARWTAAGAKLRLVDLKPS